MALAELNVRLGLIYKDLDRGLKKVERSMEASAKRINKVGREMSLAISTPLAGIGYLAIQQAGNLESLKLAMKSTFETAGSSAADAEKEVEALRKAALAPGLDFEQAIQGSIRLQGVGYAAEAARDTLTQVANAIALTGGTAQNLDSVTVQFAQMIAKGKVLSQDLRIIQENMPIISRLMKQAFGTQNAEALQKMGISGKEFVDRITEAARELPRVEGGIKNALVNAAATARQALATLGEEINKAFNVTGLLDRLGRAMQGAVDWFKKLDDSSKRIIVQFAAIATAAGPLILVFGKLFQVYAVARTGIIAASNAITLFTAKAKINEVAVTGLTGAIQKARVAFGALNAAQRALLVGGIITIIASLAVVINELANSTQRAQTKQEALADVQGRAASETAVQRIEVERLTKTLNDENATLSSKERALKRLQQISPEYYGELSLAQGKVEGLTEATNKYTESLLRAAAAQAAQEKITELTKANQDLLISQKEELGFLDRLQYGFENLGQTIENVSKFGGLGFAGAESQATAARNAAIQKQVDGNNEIIKSLIGIAIQTDNVIKGNKDLGDSLPPDNLPDATKKAELYKNALASINAVVQKGDVLGADLMVEQSKEIANQIERLLENGFKPTSAEVLHLQGLLKGLRGELAKTVPNLGGLQFGTVLPTQVVSIEGAAAAEDLRRLTDAATRGVAAASQYKTQWEGVADVMISLSDGTVAFSSSIGQAIEVLNQHGRGLEGTFLAAAAAMGDAFATAEGGFDKMALAAVAAGAKVIKVTIQEGVARAVASALQSVPFPFNLALGALAGGLAAGLFSKAIGAIGVPALAHGGVIDKPTMALIGEYPGAANNPEIVTPENKLRSIFEKANPALSGELVARVSGNDLLFIVDKAANRRGRVR